MTDRIVKATKKFEKDVALAIQRGKDTKKLKMVIDLLVTNQSLPQALKDHALRGNFREARDLHIEPDWVLIYKRDDEKLQLIRTGTHTDLFGK